MGQKAAGAVDPAKDGRRPPPPAPSDLGEAGRRLWTAVVGEFAVEEHQAAVLLAACRETDVAEQADATVREDGAYGRDRYGGRKAHPALAVARSSRLAAARLLRVLNLDPPEPSPGPGRYPRGFRR